MENTPFQAFFSEYCTSHKLDKNSPFTQAIRRHMEASWRAACDKLEEIIQNTEDNQ